MRIEASTPVGTVAAEHPGTIPFFREKGIDYCCGGGRPLWQVLQMAGLPLEEGLAQLDRCLDKEGRPKGEACRWGSLQSLLDHILRTHHVFTRTQLDLAEGLSEKVLRAHGAKHPELKEVDDLLRKLSEELRLHLLKEEQVGFPYLSRLEDAALAGRVGGLPLPYEVFRDQPERCLREDHEATGRMLKELRRLTSDLRPPEGACVSYRAFYRALEELEEDIHQHIHLENNVLFPMAERLASALPDRTGSGH